MMTKYKPRGDILIVEKMEKVQKKVGGIYLPENDWETLLATFKVLAVGPNVKDIEVGNVILAEDAFSAIDKTEPNIGMLNQKFIHLIQL